MQMDARIKWIGLGEPVAGRPFVGRRQPVTGNLGCLRQMERWSGANARAAN